MRIFQTGMLLPLFTGGALLAQQSERPEEQVNPLAGNAEAIGAVAREWKLQAWRGGRRTLFRSGQA